MVDVGAELNSTKLFSPFTVAWTSHINRDSLLEKSNELMVNCLNYTGSDPFYTEIEVADLAGKIDKMSPVHHLRIFPQG